MRGVSIILKKRTQTGTDAFNEPIYTTTDVTVDNVLVGIPTVDDVQTSFLLHGKKAVYTLAIPKGDTNDWEDTEVVLPEPFAGTYHTVGYVQATIDALTPTRWNKKINVERIQNG